MAAKKTATTKTPTKRTTKTKAEIADGMAKATTNMQTDPNETSATIAARRSSQSAAIKAADQYDATSLVNQLSTVGLRVNDTIGGLIGQLTSLNGEYKVLNEAVAAKKEELEVLADIETIHDARASAFEEYEAEMRLHQQRVESAKDDFEKQLADQEQQFKDTFASLDKARKAEEEKYAYDLKVKRRNEADAYDQEKIKRDRLQADEDEKRKKAFEERDAALKAQEQAYKDALTRIAGLDTEIKAIVKAEVGKAEAIQKKDLTNEFAMKTKDFEAQIGLMNATAKQKDDTITSLRAQLAGLEAQNARLQEQVTQIATKAIEGASNETAFTKASNLIERSQPNGNKAKGS